MDEQVDILRAIWNEMKALNGRVTTTNSKLEDLKSELKSEISGIKVEMIGMRADIDLVHRRSVERDIRLGTSLTELARDVRELTHDWRDEHRLDRAELHERVGRLERHAGLEPR